MPQIAPQYLTDIGRYCPVCFFDCILTWSYSFIGITTPTVFFGPRIINTTSKRKILLFGTLSKNHGIYNVLEVEIYDLLQYP